MTLFARELAGFFYAPIAYAVGALFLVVQGALFWALVELLADPASAPIASLMPTYLGGQIMFWLSVLVVVAVSTMRLVAEERRSGTWEMLLTAPVSEPAVVLSKWAAALVFASFLWLPTLLYPALLSWASVAPGGVDGGALLASYACLELQLAAFVAIGCAVSAATRSQLVAAAATVLGLAALLLVGQIPPLADWSREGLGWAVASHLDVRAHLMAAARGELSTGAVFLYLSVSTAALYVAYAGLGRARLRRDRLRRRWIGTAPILVILISSNVIVGRHSRTFDLSSAGMSTLSEESKATLARIEAPVEVLVVEPSFDRFRPIYAQVELALERMGSASPLLRAKHLDPLEAPAVVERSARSFGLDATELAEGGMVVVRSGERQAVIEVLDLAGFRDVDLGIAEVSPKAAEAALVAAVARVSASDVPRICFSLGHGESIAGSAGRARFADIERRLVRDGLSPVRLITLAPAELARCAVLVVLAPRTSLSADEAMSVAGFSAGGGGLFVAAAPLATGPTGLELVLAELGLAVAPGIARDPSANVGAPDTWGTSLGHDPTHPISARFYDRRTTIWRAPRPVVAVDGAPIEVLVKSSEETPVAAAVERRSGRGRAVLWGAGAAVELAPASANLELLLSSISWLAGREATVAPVQSPPASRRLLLSASQRSRLFLASVVGMPLVLIAAGLVVAWRRRRV